MFTNIEVIQLYLSHSLIHSLAHSLTHSFTHSLTHTQSINKTNKQSIKQTGYQVSFYISLQRPFPHIFWLNQVKYWTASSETVPLSMRKMINIIPHMRKVSFVHSSPLKHSTSRKHAYIILNPLNPTFI